MSVSGWRKRWPRHVSRRGTARFCHPLTPKGCARRCGAAKESPGLSSGGDSSQSGVALIFALGILTLLLVMGVSFVMNMMAENRMTENWVRSLRARLASQAGLERAIAEMQLHAQNTATDSSTESWAWTTTRPSFNAGGGISGTLADGSKYILKISDGNSRLNLNVAVQQNVASSDLVLMLQQLPGLDVASATNIINYRNTLPGRKFTTKEQVMLAGINKATYDQFQDFITLNSYVDPNASEESGQATSASGTTLADSSKVWGPNAQFNRTVRVYAGRGSGQSRVISGNTANTLSVSSAWSVVPDTTSLYAIMARAPVNVNTAADEVLTAVLTPVLGQGFIAALKAQRPIRTWRQFESVVNDANVRNNANPNRTKPVTHTTEFCFNGGGVFEMESTGHVLDSNGVAVLSEQKIRSAVQVYKILAESQKWQWARTPEFYRVTWMNTCPTDLSTDNAIDFPANYTQVSNALKIGYWDNFQEDNNYTATMWATNVSGGNGSARFDLTSGNMQFTNPTGLSENKFPEFLLAYKQGASLGDANSEDSWNFNDFYLRVTNNDDTVQLNSPMVGEGDVGRIRFRSAYTGTAGDAAFYAYVRNKGMKYIENTDAPSLPGGGKPYTQQYMFEITVDDGHGGRTGTGNYEMSGTKYKGRKFGGTFGVVQDLDGVPMTITLGTAFKGDAASPAPPDSDKPQTTDLTYYVKFISRAVFHLGDSGPDSVHGETYVDSNGQTRYYPDYLYPYTYNDPGSVHKTYRVLARDVRNTANKAQAVSMGVQDGGSIQFPGAFLGDGEIDTFIRRAGLVGLKGNACLPWWDDIRIISPDGNLRSAVWDAGETVRLGTVAWTNSTADENNEPVSVDVRASNIANMTQTDGTTPVTWSYSPNVFAGSPPEITRNICTGQITASGLALGNVSGRFLQYRVYLETRRVFDAPAGNTYLRATPVLEDISLTYLPRAKVISYR